VTLALLAALAAPAAADDVIKTVQPKHVLKVGRIAVTPMLAAVTNSHYLRRRFVGASLAWHLSDIFAVETTLAWGPDLGTADWKPITWQLLEENKVVVELSRLTLWGTGAFQFTPIHGKFAWNGRRVAHFELFGLVGGGFAQTVDDLDAMGATDDPLSQATAIQWHGVATAGAGARLFLSNTWALRVEGRNVHYLETLGAVDLLMKNNFLVAASASAFFP